MPDSSPSAERIVNAALDLVLAQGVKKTSLEEVAQRAGVTRVTVYRYFRDKKGLVRASVVRWWACSRRLRGVAGTGHKIWSPV